MTLKAALESGKRFKRKGWETWWKNSPPGYQFGIEEVIAEDWIVEPKPFEFYVAIEPTGPRLFLPHEPRPVEAFLAREVRDPDG
ncbi:MAG: hypothetical protein H0X02_03415, partial [Nitrosomonas sp.]|nr:hypothetical protein [Nitrosomonas sp.]